FYSTTYSYKFAKNTYLSHRSASQRNAAKILGCFGCNGNFGEILPTKKRRNMKLKFILLLVIIFGVKSFGQINQVENLTWSHWYDYPNNFFELQWEAPTQPHDELVGYNIYRNNEWFRFQTETSLYNLYSDVHGFISNCDIDFLTVDNQNQPYESAISVHVTAVYNPNHIESDYSQTVFVEGFMLSINDHIKSKTTVFPNPTNGILNIEHPDLEKID